MGGNYIPRDMQALLKEASQYFSVICITGPRQSGKRTILKEMFPQAVKYSLKDVNVREFALNDPVAFLNQTSEMMFID
ncbi:MAG: ATP-binding protein, partial [Bacteroidales bacterium]|nr:ATP-binding protein [Bacteroidales bacterium]